MRWDAMFDDLEAQAEAVRDEQWREDVAERTRSEQATVALAARIAASRGLRLSVTLVDGSRTAGDVGQSGATWVVLADGTRRHLVALSAVAMIEGLSPQSRELTAVESRLGMEHVLRALSREGARVRVHAGVDVTGVIGAVRADHVDLVPDGDGAAALAIPVAGIRQVTSA